MGNLSLKMYKTRMWANAQLLDSDPYGALPNAAMSSLDRLTWKTPIESSV